MPSDVTREELAAYAAGEADTARAPQIETHLASCPACRHRLDAICAADAALEKLAPYQPPAAAEQAARRAIDEAVRSADAMPEVLTLDEVARFLRVSPAELDEFAMDLPAFEIAGRVRVRKARLIEWIESRERAYARDAALGGVPLTSMYSCLSVPPVWTHSGHVP